MPRANLYLQQAIGVLRTHANFPPDVNRRDAWSSAYLPLAALLGKPLTESLRKCGELRNDFVYCGTAYSDNKLRDEHVIPMRCVVKHLMSTPHLWDSVHGVSRLREFLSSHLVLARIPMSLETLLVQQAMPNDLWHQPVSRHDSVEEKNRLVWARYIAVEGLRMHWQEGAHFATRSSFNPK